MNNKIVKGLLLMASSIFVAIQAGDVVWGVTLLTAACIGVGYFTKNVFFPSVSEDGVFDWRDVASAAILAVVAAIGDSVGQIFQGGQFYLQQLLSVIGAAVFTYFSTTFFGAAKK
jgi:hypothetical protein